MMLRSLFLKEMRDQRGSLLLWSLGIIGYVVLMCSVYPSIGESQEALEDLLEAMPPAFKAFVMGQAGDFFTPTGYLGARVFAFLSPLVLLILAVGCGTRAVAGEEDAGTMSLLLSHPTSRSTVLAQKLGVLLATVTIAVLAHLVGLLIGIAAVDMAVSTAAMLQASLALWLLGVLGGMLAFAAGAAGARRGVATAAAAGVLLVSYLLDTIGLLVSDLETLRSFSIFSYYSGGQVATGGLVGTHVAVLVACIIVCMAAAFPAFLRRDIRQ